jgi:hypothetical protein
MRGLIAMSSAPFDVRWKVDLMESLRRACLRSPYEEAFCQTDEGSHHCGVHLAVLVEPYLTFILEGKKTIESRFSVNRHAPFEQVQRGDIIVLKRSSGPVEGICRVADAWFYQLDPKTWPEIERYASALCMDDSSFWKQKRGASYASLMRIEDIIRVPSFDIDKLDPRGWVVLRQGPEREQRCLF